MENENIFDLAAVKLLYETTKSEYENEHSRTSIIDSKTSISLPIIATYFLALVQMNDFKQIMSVEISSFYILVQTGILFVTYLISLVFAFVAVINMVRVILTKDYDVIKPIDMYEKGFLQNNVIVLYFELIKLYVTATTHNKSKNDARIPLYKKGWLFTVISISIFTIYTIMHNLKYGGWFICLKNQRE